MKTGRTIDSWILAGAVVVGTTAAGGLALAAEGFEPAPTLKAAEVAPPALLKGPKHTLAPTAKGDGFLLSFDVKSEFGTWHAIDLEMLDVRVKEVYSLAQLSDVSKTEIFAQAFGKAAEEKAKAVGRAVSDPVGTAKAIPGGVARFAKGVARTAKGTADSVVANQKDAPADDRTTTDKAQDAAVAGASAAGDALVAGKRREWAQKVGADPYTTNQQLSDKLDEVAWTAYAGGFALNFAVPSIPGLGMVETADKLVYDLPPGDLQKRNDDKLKAAGITDAARKALFVNRNFTPTIETELVDAIAALGAAHGQVPARVARGRIEDGGRRALHPPLRADARGGREGSGRLEGVHHQPQRDRGGHPRPPARPALGGRLHDVERRDRAGDDGPGPGGDGARGVDLGRRDGQGEAGAEGEGLRRAREAARQVKRGSGDSLGG